MQDVHAWINWTASQYGLSAVSLEYFNMNGVALCQLSEDDFRQRASCGDVLYAQLDIWKTASYLPSSRSVQTHASAFRAEESVTDMSMYLQWGAEKPAASSPVREATSPDVNMPGRAGSDYSSEGGFQSDDDASEDSCESDKTVRSGSSHSHIHLWQFLKELLTQPQIYGSCIRWLDRPKGVFKIEDSVRVARLWGRRKNRPAMNYDKLSRSIRQYYKKGIMKKTERSQRLVYQFCHPYCL